MEEGNPVRPVRFYHVQFAWVGWAQIDDKAKADQLEDQEAETFVQLSLQGKRRFFFLFF